MGSPFYKRFAWLCCLALTLFLVQLAIMVSRRSSVQNQSTNSEINALGQAGHLVIAEEDVIFPGVSHRPGSDKIASRQLVTEPVTQKSAPNSRTSVRTQPQSQASTREPVPVTTNTKEKVTVSRECLCEDASMQQKDVKLPANNVPACSDPRSYLNMNRTSTGQNNVASFSIFGSDIKWSTGMLLNVLLFDFVYPGWSMRLYHDLKENTESCRLFCKARSMYSSLHLCHIDLSVPGNVLQGLYKNRSIKAVPGSMWRFLPMADLTVDVAVFRDSDSIVNFRELAAVKEWLSAANITLHSMNDHYGHSWPLMAGMFGVNFRSHPELDDEDGSIRALFSKLLRDMFHLASMGINYFKEADQTLLIASVVNHFNDWNDWLRHDSFFCNEVLGRTAKGNPFPTRRNDTQDGVYFVGSSIDNPIWVVELFNSSTTKPNITFRGVTSKWTGNPNLYEDEPCHV